MSDSLPSVEDNAAPCGQCQSPCGEGDCPKGDPNGPDQCCVLAARMHHTLDLLRRMAYRAEAIPSFVVEVLVDDTLGEDEEGS